MKGDNKKILIPEFSWWYYNKVASECYGTFEMYPLYEKDDTFAYDVDEVIEYTNRIHPRMLLLASPNNPTGNNIMREEIIKVIEQYDGLVIVDEAYIDFSSEPTILRQLTQHPNLIVLHTMSKAWGSAAIRLGMAFAQKDIIDIFNKVKYPYNINLLTQEQALKRLNDTVSVERWVNMLLQERGKLMQSFSELPICKQVYPTDANFFLAKMTNAQDIYDYLVEKGIIVRNRTRITLCQNCLRVTIGTKEENSELLGALRMFQ